MHVIIAWKTSFVELMEIWRKSETHTHTNAQGRINIQVRVTVGEHIINWRLRRASTLFFTFLSFFRRNNFTLKLGSVATRLSFHFDYRSPIFFIPAVARAEKEISFLLCTLIKVKFRIFDILTFQISFSNISNSEVAEFLIAKLFVTIKANIR